METKKRKPKRKTKWDAFRDEHGLTHQRRKYVEVFANPESPTFMKGTKSAAVAYNTTTEDSADAISCHLQKDPRVQRALKDIFKTQRIDKLIEEGALNRLEDPQSRHWQPTADFIAKVRGDFAPEKHVNVNLTPEERDSRYDEIIKKVQGAHLQPANEEQKVISGE